MAFVQGPAPQAGAALGRRCRAARCPSSSRVRRRRTLTAIRAASGELYGLLGLQKDESLTSADIRQAYLDAAKQAHPDSAQSPRGAFEDIAQAYKVLSDPVLREVYDATGAEGLAALDAIKARAKATPRMTTEEMTDEEAALSRGSVGGIMLEAGMPEDEMETQMRDDACPRSIEEAIWNVKNHKETGYRYYAAWWISRFRVAEAENALVHALQTDSHRTANGGYPIRRRAAVALGTAARPPTQQGNPESLAALGVALGADDYFLRYRAAEAIARITQRNEGRDGVPQSTIDKVSEMIEQGAEEISKSGVWASGFSNQQSLFEFDHLEPEVREKLKTIFKEREKNEARSRRTTMTPNLDVTVSESDQPYEWLLKSAGFMGLQHLIPAIEKFAKSDVPLVRYASFKALYQLTGDENKIDKIVGALEMGAEHHYSQRILIRDLGDVGHVPSASAMAACGMVENSFKILALKNLLLQSSKEQWPAKDLEAVYSSIDSLL